VLIPYNTDAPIYHFPFVTIGLIVVNAAVLVACAQANPHDVEQWMLQFGRGLHPVQWISNNFMHGGIMHLVGNMFFLWGFGLVVEGKLGWWRFLLLYLTIGAIYSVIIQTSMLGATEGGALGASGAIFGLMVISLIWAPKNEMSCFLWILFRPQLVEVPITVFAAVYLVWQGLIAWLTGFSMSSAMLHLTGAGVGAVFGVALLKLELVDCEGWDLFAVWGGRERSRLDERKSPAPSVPDPQALRSIPADHAMFLASALKNRLAKGDAAGAAEFYEKQRDSHPDWKLEETQLMELIKSLHKQQLWSASVRPMTDCVRQFPDNSIRIQLKLAQILLEADRRPAKALKVLRGIDATKLGLELHPVHKRLLDRAEQMQADGDLNVADTDN
jgi:membrane associated rhomboid family serine protease